MIAHIFVAFSEKLNFKCVYPFFCLKKRQRKTHPEKNLVGILNYSILVQKIIYKNRVLRMINLYRLHLLANRAVIWHQIWGSLHKMTCSTPCSPNLTPQRERSRASPTKTVPSVSIRSRKYVGSSCKTSKDVSQVCMYVVGE